MMRHAILAAARSERLGRFVERHGMRLGAGRFVAGTTLDDCVRVIRRLNDDGLHANTTLLGESVTDAAGAREVRDEYVRILQRLWAERLRCNVALKLTHLGLVIDEELAYGNVKAVVEEAARLATFVRIDMEDSPWVDATLRIYGRLRADGLDNVGTVLQAYLYGRRKTSTTYCRSTRTSVSSRARTSSRPRSRFRRRRTAMPTTCGCSSAC